MLEPHNALLHSERPHCRRWFSFRHCCKLTLYYCTGDKFQMDRSTAVTARMRRVDTITVRVVLVATGTSHFLSSPRGSVSRSSHHDAIDALRCGEGVRERARRAIRASGRLCLV